MTDFEQQPLTPEQELAEQVMSRARTAYEHMHELLYRDTAGIDRQELEDTAQAKQLNGAIGTFAVAHIEQIDTIHEQPYTSEMYEALSEYIATVMARKIDRFSFEAMEEKYQEEITGLMAGRTIQATVLNARFGHDIGAGMTSYGGNPQTVTGELYRYYPSRGDMWLSIDGQPTYIVPLWKHKLTEDRQGLKVVQGSELTILPAEQTTA